MRSPRSAVAAGAAVGWSRTLFEVYWILGAVLNVPLLAAGEVHLLGRNAVLDLAVWVVLAFVFAYTIAVTRGARDGSRRARGTAAVRQGGLR